MEQNTIIEPITTVPRYIRHNAVYAISDVYDALVELITNSDDSYNRQKATRRPIRVEIDRRRGKPSLIKVRDRAEGMTLQEMRQRLGILGKRSSADTDRGFMSRGAKDCASLGDVKFESIKDDKFYSFIIRKDFNIEYGGRKKPTHASEAIRKKLGIKRGNGTVVTIELDAQDNVNIPNHDTLLKKLPCHFALRDMLLEKSETKVEIIDLSKNNYRRDPIISYYPAGKEVVKDCYQVPGYNDITFDFELYRSEEPFLGDNPSSRFRLNGILIKDIRAIHEISYLDKQLDSDPYAQRYFGKITCPHIRTLCEEYDRLKDLKQPAPPKNPIFILDPNRKSGLARNHPFFKSLSNIVLGILQDQIKKDKDGEKENERVIENEETKKRLNQLAKAASSYLKDKLANIDDFSDQSNKSSEGTLIKQGVAIFPEYVKLEVGEIKTCVFRVIHRPGINYQDPVFVKTDNESVQIIHPEITLKKTQNTKFMYARFDIKGLRPTHEDPVGVSAKFDGFPEAVAFIKVVPMGSNMIDLPPLGIAFEKGNYTVRQGKQKRLRLYADLDKDFSLGDTVHLISTNQTIVILGKPPVLIQHEKQSNIAVADFKIMGRQHGARGQIQAQIDKSKITATVVVKEDEEEPGIPMKIEILDKEFGGYRAKWDVPNNPNFLIISSRHPSIKRYLGPPDEFVGQETKHFKLLLAEIVAERISQRVMEAKAQQDPRAFSSEEGLDIHSFYFEHNKIMTEFLPIAHSIQLADQEINLPEG